MNSRRCGEDRRLRGSREYDRAARAECARCTRLIVFEHGAPWRTIAVMTSRDPSLLARECIRAAGFDFHTWVPIEHVGAILKATSLDGLFPASRRAGRALVELGLLKAVKTPSGCGRRVSVADLGALLVERDATPRAVDAAVDPLEDIEG